MTGKQGRVEAPILREKRNCFGLGYKPDARKKNSATEWRRSQMGINDLSHISKTFVSGGTIHPEQKMSRKEIAEEMLGNLNINAISEEGIGEENLSGICPYVPGSIPRKSFL
ncbi:trans-resveratrol di-O-methyltransferase-like [Gossypium australe]|uniref:Trans-resveratrol di-O-methyltransferase-like n=1 Tax=Gossypium australe TaxID=47621 RepID=A0A5B6WH12_9ROSI|nr:trans-resveratrol di-O-methyltransferase-like [Gossypium australe]